MIDRGSRVIVVAALLAGTIAAEAGPAQAQRASVGYASYELQTQAGTEAVFGRIERATARACLRGVTLAELKEARLCKADLTAQLVGKVDNRMLTARWAGRRDIQLASRSQ